jgi:hypothetical protein
MSWWTPPLRQSFQEELPHQLLLDEPGGIVLLAQTHTRTPALALGCVWSVVPRNIEPLDDQACDDLAALHEHLIRMLPTGAALQVLTTIMPATSHPAWETVRASLAAHPAVQAQVAAFRTGLPHQDPRGAQAMRDYTTTLTLRLPLPALTPDVARRVQALLKLPGNGARYLAAMLVEWQANALARLEGLRLSFESLLQAAGHGVTRCTGVQIGHLLALALEPGRTPLPLIDDERPLYEQVMRRECQNIPGGYAYGYTDMATNGFHEVERAQVLALHKAPPGTYPGILCATRAPEDGEPIALWNAWPGPMVLTTNVAVAHRAVEKARLSRKSWLMRLHTRSSPEMRTIVEQLDALAARFLLGGGELHWGRAHLTLWGTHPQLQQGVDRAMQLARGLRLDFQPEPTLGSTFLLHSLPLGFDPQYPSERWVQRERRMPVEHIARCLQLYEGMQGTRTCGVSFLNDRGAPLGWHPFDSPTNPHFLVTGTSGGGKTYLLGYLVDQLLSLGLHGTLIEPLQNYRHLQAVWQGNRITIDFETPPCLNLFYGDRGPEHQSFAATCLSQLSTGGLKLELHGWTELNILASGVRWFFRTWDNTRGEPTLGPFVHEVLEQGAAWDDDVAKRLARDIALRLQMFIDDTPLARFLDGTNTFAIQPGLNVIELAALKDQKQLRGILFFIIMHLLTTFYRLPAYQLAHKFMIFDEVWAMEELEQTAQEVGKTVRTCRNDKICVGFASQLPHDWQTPMGSTIRGLADTKFFLKHEESEMGVLRDTFRMTPAEERLFRRVGKFQGWSSLYLQLAGKQGGVVRVIPNRFFDLGMSQDIATSQQRLQAQADAGGDHLAGLQALVGAAHG